MNKFLKKGYFLIGLFIFIWIIKDIDFNHLKNSLSGISISYFLLAIILNFPNIFFKSYRWKKIMDTQKIFYSTKNSFLMYGSSSLLGLATPGKLGDFSKIIYLKKDNYSFSRAFLGNFLDKFFDLLFIFIFGIITLFFLPLVSYPIFNYYTLSKWLGLIILVLLIIIIFFYLKNKVAFYNLILEISTDLKKFKLKDTSYIFLLTITQWIIYFLIIYFIAISINIHHFISFFYLSFSSTLVILISLLPISIMGIGTREAVLIFLLTPFGLAKETIILFSLLILINYLSPFFIYLYCWIKKPLL
ncbi:MAG: lysylphosphatidylglycerol synthase transmembrane domain-containing protein [Patescibacteria group bacterium]